MPTAGVHVPGASERLLKVGGSSLVVGGLCRMTMLPVVILAKYHSSSRLAVSERPQLGRASRFLMPQLEHATRFPTPQLEHATRFPMPQLEHATLFPMPQLERATRFRMLHLSSVETSNFFFYLSKSKSNCSQNYLSKSKSTL